MATQTASNYNVNLKVETTEGTAATGGAATGERLRTLDSPGLKLARGIIRSAERRNDGNESKPRLGGKSVEGSYNVELSQGAFDTLIEALMRSTWVAPVAITFDGGAALTSLTVDSSSQVTFAGTTTPAVAGLREGDVFRLTNMSTGANNNVNCRVKTIAGSVVTLHGTPLTTQAADSACTLTIQKKVAQAATPTRRSFTFEQYLEDADVSEQFVGVRCVSLRLQLQPNGMVTATFGFIGMNRTALATGSSPYFTSPTEYTSINLVADDASLTYNGAAVTTLTGWTIDFAIAAQVQPVIGSTLPPGTFDNTMSVTGECMGTVADFSDLTLFDAETEFAMSLMLVEPESEPKSFIHIHFGAVKILDIAGDLGGDAAYIQRRQLAFTPKVAATGIDAGVCTISTG